MEDKFNTSDYYILENDSVRLTPLEISDLEHLNSFAVNEPELWKFSLYSTGMEKGMLAYIQSALLLKKEGKAYPFIVFDKKKNQYAGCTRLYDIDAVNKNLSVGYTWYGKEFQGTGLNKHCKYLLFQFVFEKIKFQRIEFRLDSNNERSMNAIKSIGCTFEGVLRSNGYKPDGSRRDSAVLSILREEWISSKQALLKSKLR